MNEGHSAFLSLELIREAIAAGNKPGVAKELISSQCIFTTHTPVPAGNDAFSEEMMRYYSVLRLNPMIFPGSNSSNSERISVRDCSV
ncbi:MAG: hypothetical protein U5N56_01635 [Candidatus Marinimicrobia bacterium]|nr:hypothetical protein [Candidatus Neomarinimicrobiota bacterium]